MKKRLAALLLLVAAIATLLAQTQPVSVAKNANHFVYATYDYGERIDTQYTQIEIHGSWQYLVMSGDCLPSEYHNHVANTKGSYIKGYSTEDIFVDASPNSPATHTATGAGPVYSGSSSSTVSSSIIDWPTAKS